MGAFSPIFLFNLFSNQVISKPCLEVVFDWILFAQVYFVDETWDHVTVLQMEIVVRAKYISRNHTNKLAPILIIVTLKIIYSEKKFVRRPTTLYQSSSYISTLTYFLLLVFEHKSKKIMNPVIIFGQLNLVRCVIL